MSLERTVQIQATAPKRTVTGSQYYKSLPFLPSKAFASLLCSLVSEWNNIQKRDVMRSRVRRDVNKD